MADSEQYVVDPNLFDYDRGLFVKARSSVLNSAMDISTARSTLKGLSGPDPNLFIYDGTSSTAYLGVTPFKDTYDYTSVSEATTSLKSASEYISGLNEQMYSMVDAICEIDPDIADEIKNELKKLEAEILRDYTQMGMAGMAIDAVQLYALLEKNLDNPYLGLTDGEKEFLSIVKEKAEYANMSFGEKLDQSIAVFVGSAVEGVIQVGEYVVDGTVILCANALAYGEGVDAETRKNILENAYGFTDKKFAEDFYDIYVESNDLNKYLSYGAVHQVGLATGKVAGETLLTMIPGGKAVQVYTKVASSMGKAAGSRNKNVDIELSNGLALGSGAVTTAFSLVASAKSDTVQGIIKDDPTGFVSWQSKDMWELRGIRVVGSVANSGMRYASTAGEKSFKEFVKEDAKTVIPEIIGTAVGDELKIAKVKDDALKQDSSDLYKMTKGVTDIKNTVKKYGVDKAMKAGTISDADIGLDSDIDDIRGFGKDVYKPKSGSSIIQK